MTVLLDLKAKRAAARQYVDASERLAQKSLRELQAGHPDRAKWMALFANDLRAWGKAECS